MIDTLPEQCIPWDRTQTERRLDQLDDSLVNLREVLYQITPDHIHLPNGGLPLWINLLGAIRNKLSTWSDPRLDAMYELVLKGFIRREGVRGFIAGDFAYEPLKSYRLQPRWVLRFREVDFSFPVTSLKSGPKTYSINTTRVEGSHSIYHVFIHKGYRNFLSDYLVYEEGQGLVNTILDARVLNPIP